MRQQELIEFVLDAFAELAALHAVAAATRQEIKHLSSNLWRLQDDLHMRPLLYLSRCVASLPNKPRDATV